MTAVLLYPGAGTDASHPSLVAIERAVAPTPCVRADFPYRKLGRRAPDRPPVLMAAVRSELDGVVGEHGAPVVMGGRSMGGRMCSMVAAGADGSPPPAEVAGLVLICYPLHPPGKPERIRDEHLYRIDVPMIFVEGTRDPFATPDLLAGVLAKLGDRADLISIEGGDHSMNVKGGKRDAREVAAGLAEPVAAAIRERMP
jgi:hypothetical protein